MNDGAKQSVDRGMTTSRGGARCPTRGREFRNGMGAEELLHVLHEGVPHRKVYRGRDGGWYVTYGGGQAAPDAVEMLAKRGDIHPVYSNIPDGAYHVGRTLYVDATLEWRRLYRDKCLRVYVGEAP